MKVYFCDISALTQEQLKACFEEMSEEKKTEIIRMKNPASAKQRIAADNLCKKAISEFCSVCVKDIVIKRAPSGKPYAQSPNVKFSVSHSKELAVCAVSDMEIGIDAEKIRKVYFKTANRFATEEEILYIGENTERFFEIWTLKEAYFKCIGTGLGADIKNVSFRVSGGEVECSEKGFKCSFYPLADGYCCSICEKISDAGN
ncbi:MAG: 4'-phosphopantetheinyl transferase superfamily protein [Clostridia bacterium]|nr:4'-phosphopantetheinyl transferase superfamily protein [Clostridia bacterium]